MELTKNFKKIGKNVIVNTTPHPISFLSGAETIIVDTDAEFILNAKATEKAVSEIFVTTEFVGTAEGNALIDDIEEWFNSNYTSAENLVIVGSIIAAQAYKGRVVAMTPAKGYERVAPAEKRMNPEKFTIFLK